MKTTPKTLTIWTLILWEVTGGESSKEPRASGFIIGLTKLLDEEKNKAKHDEYSVEEIVRHQCFANKTRQGWYLSIKWVGYEDPTWEPMKKLKAQLPEEVNKYVEAHKEAFNCCPSITRAVEKKNFGSKPRETTFGSNPRERTSQGGEKEETIFRSM